MSTRNNPNTLPLTSMQYIFKLEETTKNQAFKIEKLEKQKKCIKTEHKAKLAKKDVDLLLADKVILKKNELLTPEEERAHHWAVFMNLRSEVTALDKDVLTEAHALRMGCCWPEIGPNSLAALETRYQEEKKAREKAAKLAAGAVVAEATQSVG